MKSAPWLVLAGTVAGFLGVLGLHKSPSASGLSQAVGQPSAQAASPAAGPAGTATATGPTEPYGYGELKARITISGGHITTVTVPLLRTAEQYSQQLADQVIPMLGREVLAAQSARIQAVSGATYTSEAYALSVQAALDQVHFK
jgi:uncharacterized protein with FMN-binding domain